MPKSRGSGLRPARAKVDSPQRSAAKARRPVPRAKTAPVAPQDRPGHSDAVTLFERGMAAFYEHDFPAAATEFQALGTNHPSEPELRERAHVYLVVCQRHMARPASPETLQELLYAATVALNRGGFEEAERLLARVTREKPEHDHAHFMLALARTGRGAWLDALSALDRAVALNPENRLLALREPDLEPLRRMTGFDQAIHAGTRGRRAAR
jgi:tetratricopeptide (TPR) repeat protein